MKPLLHIKELTVAFGEGDKSTTAVKGISFIVNRGEILALVGESGSGKSVTSLSILRLLPSPPAHYPGGQILFCENGADDIDLLRLDQQQLRGIRGNKIAMIFQEPMSSLNPVIRCGEQVVEALRAHKPMSKNAARAKTVEWFERVQLPDPESIYHRYPHELSGGQKQRVMIAMAMSCEPALLICDEPTTALDVTVQKTILQLIRDLQQQTGMGVIFITHDLGVVAEIADRTVVLYKGEIVEQNTVSNLFGQPAHPYTKGLLACRPVLHKRGQRLPVVSDFLDPTRKPVLKDIVSDTSVSTTDNTAALLEVRDLTVKFPGRKSFLGGVSSYVTAVDNVSFDVYPGETLGLVGESGCGKTTLGRSLLQLVRPTAGKILYKGNDITHFSTDEFRKLRKELQIVFQDPYSSLNPRISIGSAISEVLRVHGLAGHEKQRRDQVIRLLEKVDLPAAHYNRYPHEFSGGQRQRIVIARALALNPSFIVCDESVSALDVSVQAQVLNLLNDLKKEFGFTIIFISHDLSVVRYISDRIMVMNKGRIEESGPADEVYLSPKSPYTQRLIASIPRGLATPVD